jgi:hypothetical protein
MTAYKQPSEIIPLAVDFQSILPSGESIQSVGSDVKVYDASGNDKTSEMRVAKTIGSTRIDAIIQGGTHGSKYDVQFTAKTQNYLFEEDIDLEVRNL